VIKYMNEHPNSHIVDQRTASGDNPSALRETHDRVIYFDGVCNVCNAFVDFVIRRDPAGLFKFAPLQSTLGRCARAEAGNATDIEQASIVYVECGATFTKSTAMLRIAAQLQGAARLLGLLRIVPRPIRDWLYEMFGSWRYRLFGRTESCRVPTPAERERFLM